MLWEECNAGNVYFVPISFCGADMIMASMASTSGPYYCNITRCCTYSNLNPHAHAWKSTAFCAGTILSLLYSWKVTPSVLMHQSVAPSKSVS